jgi:hypothetical protein
MVLVWAKKVRTGRDISHPLHPISLQQGGLKWLRPVSVYISIHCIRHNEFAINDLTITP